MWSRLFKDISRGQSKSGTEQPERAIAPDFTGRFALYTAIALLIAGAGIFFYVRQTAISRAENQALTQTQLIGQSVLNTHLRPTDFRAPVTGARRASLDRLIKEQVLATFGLRATVYNTSGTAVYSTDPELIGKIAPTISLVAKAVQGTPTKDVTTITIGDQPSLKVLETYVPIVGGALELYQSYAPIDATARATFMPLLVVLAVVMLSLFLAFFPILRRVTGKLQNQVEEVEHQSFYDSLTGLPNRRLFLGRVEEALVTARTRGERVAVMLIDLDRFKDVNDTLGHRCGDDLLKLVGARMCSALRQEDIVARLGGDEFGVLAPNINGPEAAIALAGKMRAALLEPHSVGGLELEVDASIGITIYPNHGTDVDLLTQRADVAMYVAKKSHAPTVYSADHDDYSPIRLTLMSQLRRAIADGEMIVYYQPQADVRTGTIHSVEALVRWQHPEHGLLPPDAFIPLAEHIGLIRPLTVFVLGEALRQCQAWQRAGLNLSVAVNITGRDLLDRRLPIEVRNLLRRYEVEPEKLELEITENTVLSDPVRAREILERLNELGVKLAIDDYGTGNSSLAYLKRLPVSVLKIDKSFVLKMSTNHDDAVIVRSTIDLGHNLGLRVIAEGVEDEAAWQTLAELECDVMQGYFLAKPSPPNVIAELAIRNRSQAPQ